MPRTYTAIRSGSSSPTLYTPPVAPRLAAIPIDERHRLLDHNADAAIERRVDEKSRALPANAIVLAPCRRAPHRRERRDPRGQVDHRVGPRDERAQPRSVEELRGHRFRS